jgi:hypothetical protein
MQPEMAISLSQTPTPETNAIELQQAGHTLHFVAQHSRSISEGTDGSAAGPQLDYVQYCQV